MFVFAVTLIVNEPLPKREAGTFETVSHDWSLVGTLHPMLDVTVIPVPDAADPGPQLVGDSERVAAGGGAAV